MAPTSPPPPPLPPPEIDEPPAAGVGSLRSRFEALSSRPTSAAGAQHARAASYNPPPRPTSRRNSDEHANGHGDVHVVSAHDGHGEARTPTPTPTPDGKRKPPPPPPPSPRLSIRPASALGLPDTLSLLDAGHPERAPTPTATDGKRKPPPPPPTRPPKFAGAGAASPLLRPVPVPLAGIDVPALERRVAPGPPSPRASSFRSPSPQLAHRASAESFHPQQPQYNQHQQYPSYRRPVPNPPSPRGSARSPSTSPRLDRHASLEAIPSRRPAFDGLHSVSVEALSRKPPPPPPPVHAGELPEAASAPPGGVSALRSRFACVIPLSLDRSFSDVFV
jgi:hypothetical protein